MDKQRYVTRQFGTASELIHFLSPLNPILAVAQHYDVPTRLLDWTTRSFVACYFAASSAKLVYDSWDHIAVWALDLNYSQRWNTVKIIRTPGGTSQNQAAQSGLFTAHVQQEIVMDDIYIPEALEDVSEIYETPGDSDRLLKLTLPLQEAPELMYLCSQFGVDGSTLFPGFYGASKMVRDWVNTQVGVRPSPARIDEMLNDAAYGNK